MKAKTQVLFAVTVDGAFGWGNYNTLEAAMDRGAFLGSQERTMKFEGVDENGRTAVMTRFVTVKVEELHAEGGPVWRTARIHASWTGGKRD